MKCIGRMLDDKGRVIGIVDGPDITGAQVTVDGKVWRFDFDSYFGPLWTKRNGDAAKNQNPPKAVWDAFQKWHDKRFPKRKQK